MSDYPPPSTETTPEAEEPKPWWKKWWGITAIFIVVVTIMGTCAEDEETGDPAASPTEATSPTGEPTTPAPEETTPPEEIAEEVTEEPAEPVTETPEAPAFEPISLSGTGDDVVDVTMPADQPGIITITHQGGGNFAVISYDPDGNRIDLLANEIGNYDGTRPVNLTGTEPVGQLEITADGAWTAEVRPLQHARIETQPNVSGAGPDVFLLMVDGANSAKVTHDGTSNFAVIAWGSSRDLLVNEIGAYEGTVRVPPDTFVVDVQADGAWTFDFS